MQKKILVIILLLLSITALPTKSSAQTDGIYVFLDGKQMEFTNHPFVTNGSTLIEFRPIFESLGMSVHWDPKKKKVTGSKKGLKIEMTLNNHTAIVNGNRIRMPAAPTTRNGRTLIPLRFISESSGKAVHWDGDVKMIIINDGQPFEKMNKNAPPLNRQVLSDAYSGKISGMYYNQYLYTTMAEFVGRFGFPDYRHDGTAYSDDMSYLIYGDYVFYTNVYNDSYDQPNPMMMMTDWIEVLLPYNSTTRDVINAIGYPDELNNDWNLSMDYYLGDYLLVVEVEDFYYNSQAYSYQLFPR